MTVTHKIPSNVSPEAAALLARAYALDGDATSRALYRDWAQTYDTTMIDGLRYRSPTLVAQMLGEHLANRDAALLDIGCGTGLAGQVLAGLGFTTIDGLDISPEMVRVAQARGVYRHFLAADLNQALDMPDAQYDGATSCGIFTHGHIGAGCLDELFRILRPGAPFAFTVRHEVWEPMGFKESLARLVTDGVITEASWRLDRNYDTEGEPDGVFCVYRRS